MQDRHSNEIFFFIAGLTIGVVAALLVAPYSGEETRHLLRERVDEGRDRASDILERGKQYVERGRDSVGESMGYARRNVQEKI
jgi:gas vesicle protein